MLSNRGYVILRHERTVFACVETVDKFFGERLARCVNCFANEF